MDYNSIENDEELYIDDCDHCKQSGYLKVILIDWTTEQGYNKTSIYDPKNKKAFQYLCESGNFRARKALLPCICDYGNRTNVKNGEKWIEDEKRKAILSRAFRFQSTGLEDFQQDVVCDYLQEIAKGKVNPKQVKISDFPATTKEVIEMCKSILTQVGADNNVTESTY